MNHPSHETRVLVSFENEADRFLPEGPRSLVVDGRDALIWVNIQTAPASTQGTIHLRFWDTGERRALPQTGRPGFVLPTNQPGMVIVGRDKEIGVLDLRTNIWTPWATVPDANPRTIINDGEIVPGGRAIIFGAKDVRFAEPIAHLYLFTLDDRQISILADGQLCSNGKVVMRSGSDLFLYDIDTPKRNVVRYSLDVKGRRLGVGVVTLDLHGIDGFPDGMVAASEDSLIIAFYNPAAVESGRAIRFSVSTGEIIEEWITLGSPRVTCPHLFQRDGRFHLVLTTADEGMPAELRALAPDAGNLFIGETSLDQLPAPEVVRI